MQEREKVTRDGFKKLQCRFLTQIKISCRDDFQKWVSDVVKEMEKADEWMSGRHPKDFQPRQYVVQ